MSINPSALRGSSWPPLTLFNLGTRWARAPWNTSRSLLCPPAFLGNAFCAIQESGGPSRTCHCYISQPDPSKPSRRFSPGSFSVHHCFCVPGTDTEVLLTGKNVSLKRTQAPRKQKKIKVKYFNCCFKEDYGVINTFLLSERQLDSFQQIHCE